VDIAFGEREPDGVFAGNGVDDLGGADRDEDVVVAMPVHQSLGMRREVDVEDADLIVGEDDVVVGLDRDFDFWGGLRGEDRSQEEEEEEEEDRAAHGRDCSIGRLLTLGSATGAAPART
jgi:hypothetical protein